MHLVSGQVHFLNTIVEGITRSLDILLRTRGVSSQPPWNSAQTHTGYRDRPQVGDNRQEHWDVLEFGLVAFAMAVVVMQALDVAEKFLLNL